MPKSYLDQTMEEALWGPDPTDLPTPQSLPSSVPTRVPRRTAPAQPAASTDITGGETPRRYKPVHEQTMEEALWGPDPGSIMQTPEEPGLLEKYGPAAIEMASGPAGFATGLAIAPFTGPAAPFVPAATAALFGAGGHMLASALQGRPQKVLPTLIAGGGSALSLGPAGTIGKTALREALVNLGLTSAQSLAESGELPTLPEAVAAAGLGAAGGAAGHYYFGREPEFKTPPRDMPLPEGVMGPPSRYPLPRETFEVPLPEGMAGPPTPTPFPSREEPTLPSGYANGQILPTAPVVSPEELYLQQRLGKERAGTPPIEGWVPPRGEPPLAQIFGEQAAPPLSRLPGRPREGVYVPPLPENAPPPYQMPGEHIGPPPAMMEGRAPVDQAVEVPPLPTRTPPPVPYEPPINVPGEHPGPPPAGMVPEPSGRLPIPELPESLQARPEPAPPAPEPHWDVPTGDINVPGASPRADALNLVSEPPFPTRPGQSEGFFLGGPPEAGAGLPELTVLPADLARAARESQQATARAEDLIRRSQNRSSDVSPEELLQAVRERNAAQEGFAAMQAQMRSQRGAVLSPIVSGITRGTIGGVVGGAFGDTPEERWRNAAIGALALGGGPPIFSALMRSGAAGRAVKATNATEQAVKDLGQAARRIEYEAENGNFALAHQVADTAHANLERLQPRLAEITPDNRLFKVVADEFMSPGALKDLNLETVSGSGRILQRYSALAQKLMADAQAGDKDAAKLLRTLFGQDERGPLGKFMDFWRASVTGRVPTGLVNLYDQGATVAQGVADKFWEGIVHGVRTGHPLQGGAQGAREAYNLGSTAISRAWDGTAQFLHLAQKKPDVLAHVLDHYKEAAQKMGLSPEGEALTASSQYLKFVNAVNSVQERYFRRVWAEASLRSQMAREGMDAEAAFRNPASIPERMVNRAVNDALIGTFQNSPKSALGKDIVGLFHDHPSLYAIAPFPRYMSNRLQQIIDHNPLAFTRLISQNRARRGLEGIIKDNEEIINTLRESGAALNAPEITKAQFNIQKATQKLDRYDSPDEVLGKWLGGLTGIAAGVALRSAGIAGEHWWEAKPDPDSEKRVDFRRDSTMAQYMLVGELAKEIWQHGKVTMGGDDKAQALQVLGLRSGFGITLLDMLSGRGNTTWEGVVNLAADLAGTFGSGLFNPVGQLKDLAGAVIPEEAKLRETRDTSLQRAWGPVANQIPFLRSQVLPESPSPTDEGMKAVDYPLAHFFGVPISNASPLEQELAAQGFGPKEFYAREPDKAALREITYGQGPFVAQEGQQLINSADWYRMSDAERHMALAGLLRAGHAAGLGAIPDEQLIQDILMRRKSDTQRQLMQDNP